MSEEERAEQKAALRARFRAVRAAVPDRGAVDAAIRSRVLAEVAEATTVMLFWPLVALPVVVPGDEPRLVARRFTSEARLVAGAFGILEPPPGARLVAPTALGAVVVPALALGRDGSRLGYGGGYYDAFLATTPARRVGVVPHACLAGALPAEAHDARLDAVVTERETVRILRQAGP